jgi:hypothetical protein
VIFGSIAYVLSSKPRGGGMQVEEVASLSQKRGAITGREASGT